MNALVVERRIRIARPVADCFRYLADFSTGEQWDPGVARAVKRTPGAPRVGTEFDLTLRVLGRQVPMQYRLTGIEPDRALQLQGQGEGFEVLDRIGFTALDADHTEIHYRADMNLGAIPTPLRPIAQAWCERIGSVAMRGLRAALEDDARFESRRGPRLAERLILPAARDFTTRGYRRMRTRGLSRRMDGKVVVITGPTSGLGLAMAQLLGRLGATLLLVGRGRERLAATEQAVRDFAGPVDIRSFEAELSELAACRRVAGEILAFAPRIDVLINNAGALPLERQLTAEGEELALAINLLAPYTLTTLLAPALAARRVAAQPGCMAWTLGRVVSRIWLHHCVIASRPRLACA
jgi:dehydrogenase/reductase SDR family member 12